MLQFIEHDEAEIWAINMQKLLPDSIGLALFDNEGNILGASDAMHIGNTCMADMQKIFRTMKL